MDRNIYVIWACRLCQVLLEVFHVANQKVFLTPKIFAHFPVFVEHMNSYVFSATYTVFLWANALWGIILFIMETVEWNWRSIGS